MTRPYSGRHSLTDLDPEALTACCAVCGPTSIYTRHRSASVKEWACRSTRNRGKSKARGPRGPRTPATAAQRRREHLRYTYGLTVEQFDAMLVAQAGRCDICARPMKSPHIDHDHGSGAVRGLLCQPCNHGIGSMEDNPARLRAAADYLERHALATTG